MSGSGSSSARGGAAHLAHIHGTEEDRVNCAFYFKVGACRHGDRCTKFHNKPVFSLTVLIPHFWEIPAIQAKTNPNYRRKSVEEENRDYDEFYEDVFEELALFGEIDDIIVCENFSEHLQGNVYVKYYDEQDAERCLKAIHGRLYDNKPLYCEYSPVTDFYDSTCRQFVDSTCSRGAYCNFLHPKKPSRELERRVRNEQPHKGERSSLLKEENELRESDKAREKKRHRSRSRSKGRGSRGRSRSRGRRQRR